MPASKKHRCAVIGATGLVGQAFVGLLARHPWFSLDAVIASDSRVGRSYADATRWLVPTPFPEPVGGTRLERLEPARLGERGIRIVFSALPAAVAAPIEADLRERGFHVFSNASAHRGAADVPILIPEINAQALQMIERQGYPRRGFIITNANCTTTGLAIALAPLAGLGLRRIMVATYQALSGAGKPGPLAQEMPPDALPWIQGEEEKIATELTRILGVDLSVSATCVRVPVPHGHLEAVWAEFDREVTDSTLLDAWRGLGPASPALPSSPTTPILYSQDHCFPTPSICFDGDPPGMPIWIGRLRARPGPARFVLLVNNLVRGAAGGSVLNAEAFVRHYEERSWQG